MGMQEATVKSRNYFNFLRQKEVIASLTPLIKEKDKITHMDFCEVIVGRK